MKFLEVPDLDYNGEIITSGDNIEIRFLFTLMECYFQGGPPDEHHFLHNVPKVTVGIFISSSPGTSRAGGNLHSLSINLLHAVLLPLLLIPPSLLTDKYFIAWTRDEHSPVSVHIARKVFEVPEALEFNQVGEVNLRTLSHRNILQGVHFMF